MSRRKNNSGGRKSFFTPPQPVAPSQQQYALTPPPYPVPVLPQQGMPIGGVPHTLEVRVSIMADRDATVAKAVLADASNYWNPVLEVTRSSKREPGDPYDEEIGTLIAASRVLRAVAARMSKHAEALVKHAEDNKKAVAAQRLRKDAEQAGVHPDDAEAFGEFRTAVAEVLAEHADHGHDVVIHVPEGLTEDDVPDEIRKMAESLFGGAVQFVADGSAAMPEEIREAVEKFLDDPSAGVRRERPKPKPGKHAKGKGDNAPIDAQLLDPELAGDKG